MSGCEPAPTLVSADMRGFDMASAYTKSGSTLGNAGRDVQHGRRRLLGVRTWLGAGALTVGVGAALAGAAGVAHADTGDHPSAGSASSSAHTAGPSAGSKRSAGKTTTASVKAANTASVQAAAAVTNAAAGGTPAAARVRVSPLPILDGVASSARRPAAAATPVVKPAAASPAASQNQQTSQTIDTPFGPITLSINATVPDPGTSGVVALSVQAATPIGKASISLSGNQTFTSTPAILNEVALTAGTLHLPAPAAFLVSAAGSAVIGGLSAYNSATAFFTALQGGNVGGALQAFLAAGPKLANAVLFGQQTLTLPLAVGQTGQAAQLSIPFGGLFAPLRSVSVTFPGYSYVDQVTGVEFKVDPVDIAFAGTKFGGVAPAFLQLFGL